MKGWKQVNWFAISAILFTLAMYVTIMSPVPDFYTLPLGLTGVTAAVLALRAP